MAQQQMFQQQQQLQKRTITPGSLNALDLNNQMLEIASRISAGLPSSKLDLARLHRDHPVSEIGVATEENGKLTPTGEMRKLAASLAVEFGMAV